MGDKSPQYPRHIISKKGSDMSVGWWFGDPAWGAVGPWSAWGWV
jgi:hypothetical protein